MINLDRNNPVGRLLTIVEKLYEKLEETEIKDSNSNSNIVSSSPTSKKTVWEDILKLEDDSELELIKAMMDVSDLARASRKMIASYSSNPDLYLEGFEDVELSVLPNELTSGFVSACKISKETVLRLRFCVDLISRNYKEEGISKKELDEILKSVSELFSEVKDSNINVSVKSFLLEALENIRRSIFQYEIYGSKGLKDAFQSTLGGMLANSESLKEVEKENKGFLSKVLKVITQVDATTATAFKAKKVLCNINSLLEFEPAEESDSA